VSRHKNLKLVHKQFVLSDTSLVLAKAAVCAHGQDRFWEMNDILFANQGDLGLDDVTFIAEKQLGLDIEAFTACMDDPASDAAVKADGDAGQTAGLRGTPSLFLGGVVPGSEWVKVVNGLEDAVELIVAAAERGDDLPQAGPPGSQESHKGHNH